VNCDFFDAICDGDGDDVFALLFLLEHHVLAHIEALLWDNWPFLLFSQEISLDKVIKDHCVKINKSQ
jgi:hypothetical protein